MLEMPIPGVPAGNADFGVDLVTKLFQLGWSLYQSLAQAQAQTTPTGLAFLQKIYSMFHGISFSDVATHVRLPRMCSHPDVMNQIGSCKWPSANVTYTVIGTHHNFSAGDFQHAAVVAFGRWSHVANINPIYKSNDRTVNIIISASMIDGSFGILGQTQLPCGQQTCTSIMDDGDNFAAFDGSNPGQIDLVRVMTHELGHALGLEHIGAGNLMAPVYNDKVWLPQAGDMQELQSRYGAPKSTPPLPPAGGAANDYILRFTNGILSVDGYRLSKLVA